MGVRSTSSSCPPATPFACTINDCGTVVGIGITSFETGHPSVICTSGYLAEEVNSPAATYMSTAGHCIQDAGGSNIFNLDLNPWKNYNARSITWGKSRAFTCCAFGSGSIDSGYFCLKSSFCFWRGAP